MTSAPTSDPRLKRLLNVFIALNFLDAGLTYSMVMTKFVTEANPIMGYLLHVGPLAFGAVKMTINVTSAYMLWKARKSKWNVTGIVTGLVLCYSLLVAAEVWMALNMIGCVP